MLFNSLEYCLFFPTVVLAYFALPGRSRWAWLLAASCVFYMAFRPVYILILALTIIVDYAAGLWIAQAHGHRRKAYLALSIVANVGVLAVFKYWPFLHQNSGWLAQLAGTSNPLPALDIVLPIGLSFHTFQAMSYTIEVYRGAQPPERHLGRYALYVMYFPQLVAGPIERPQNLLPQLARIDDARFSAAAASSGLRLILWGLVKKVVVADRLASMVDSVYFDVGHADSPGLLVAAYAFSVQIYCDFSAYSDIARGSSRLLGIELMKNFDRPYASRSLTEFWRRWHISLSTWFRDYVYVPLGGSRRGRLVTVRNLLIVFLLSGLWHGANWTFVIWGAIHGFLVAASTLTKRDVSHSAARKVDLRALAVFQVVTLAWVLFRAPSLSEAIVYLQRMVTAGGWLTKSTHNLGAPRDVVITTLVAIAVLAGEWLSARHDLVGKLVAAPRALRWSVYYAAIAALVFMGKVTNQQFIYFQF